MTDFSLLFAEREGLFSPSISLEISYFCLAQYVRVRYVCHDLGFYRAKSARGGFVALFLILLSFYSLFIHSWAERNIIAVCAGVCIFAAMMKLTNIQTPVSEQKVINLLFELQCLYHEGVAAARAYDDMASSVQSQDYPCQDTAKRILDGAHVAREAELAHIRDRVFIHLRDFFEPLERGPSR